MKLTKVEIVWYFDYDDNRGAETLIINGEKIVEIRQGEPEDACFGRDLPGANDFLKVFKKGQEFNILALAPTEQFEFDNYDDYEAKVKELTTK